MLKHATHFRFCSRPVPVVKFVRHDSVTAAERSEACTVFARSEAGIVASNPTQGMDVWYVCLLCVCVVLCLGRGLATS
jgi:hypothetical protein